MGSGTVRFKELLHRVGYGLLPLVEMRDHFVPRWLRGLNPERLGQRRWIKLGNLKALLPGFRGGEACDLAGGHPNGLHAEDRHGHMSARHGDRDE